MAGEQGKLPEDNSENNLIETTGRVKTRPVPLSFGGVARKGEGALPGRHDYGKDSEGGVGYENPRRIIRQGMLVIFLFFGILGVWAFFGTIQGAVVSSGRIKIDTERKIVQHLEGGIVEEVLVREGQEVVQGEPLIIITSVRADAEANMTRKELVSLEAQRLRCLAEKNFASELVWPENLKKLAETSGNQEALANEEKIFQTRLDSLNTQISLLEVKITQLNAQISGNEEQLRAINRIIATLQDELGSKRKLHRERYVDKTQILSLERELAAQQGRRGVVRQQIAEQKQIITETNLKIVEARGTYVEQATAHLGELENRLVQARERLRPLVDTAKRLQVKAPVGGRVVDLKIHTKGAVIQPGETLMDIVPHDTPLIVEVPVPIDKIAEVYVGQNASVQLTAFDTRLIPHIPAKVTHLSADALEPRPGFSDIPYFLCYVEVDPEALMEERLYLSPGMPATVFITTKERTIVYYMFEPYIKAWERALRD